MGQTIVAHVWVCIGKCQSERLQKLQNRAARIITSSDYITLSSCLLLSLAGIHTKQLAITMYKVVNVHVPLHLNDFFKQNRKFIFIT